MAKPGRPCTVCEHDEHSIINAALHAGMPVRQVADRHGLTKDAVQRHKTNHASAAWTSLTPEQVAQHTEVADIDRELQELLADLRLARNAAVNRETGHVNIPHLDRVAGRITQAIELFAKLERRLGPNTVVDARSVTVNLAQSEEWQAIVTTLMAALAPYPNARQAAADALVGRDALPAGDVVDVEVVE